MTKTHPTRFAFIAALAAALLGSTAAMAEVKAKIGHAMPDTHPQATAVAKFAELAGTYTNHRQTIVLSIRDGQLHARRRGSTTQGAAGYVMRTGENRIAITGSGDDPATGRPTASFVIVRDSAGRKTALRGPVRDPINGPRHLDFTSAIPRTARCNRGDLSAISRSRRRS